MNKSLPENNMASEMWLSQVAIIVSLVGMSLGTTERASSHCVVG
ncbi:hypothetical protein N9U68_00780 [Euryarchaeota archaeon]|nr:hypothetical protein [Euryarchaeota archaeon]